MSDISDSLLSNFDEIKNSDNNIILFGSVGAGKTTLINKICGKSFVTASKGFSCTREVQFSYSLNHKDRILDFPGLNSSVDIAKHLKIQKNTLSAIPLRMICFVIKFTSRYDDLVKSASQMLMIFKEYRKNILLILTNTENVSVSDKAEVEFIFNQRYKIPNVLFTQLDMDGSSLSNSLHDYMKNMENIKEVKIESRDLLKTVDPEFDIDMQDDREQYLLEFKENLKIFESEFKSATDKNLKRAIFFALRGYKDELIESYSNIVKKKKLEEDLDAVITELIMFNNSIFNDYDSFRKKVELELEIQQTNYNGEMNRYKRCPHCGEIWFRIKGCSGIICGRRSLLKDRIWGFFKNYIVSFSNKKLTYTTLEQNNNQLEGKDEELVGLSETEKAKNMQLKREGKQEIAPRGCGKTLNWDQMEDVTDYVNRELKSISASDYDSKVLNIRENMEKNS